MSAPSDNENWIVARGGDVVEKQVKEGPARLTTWERLVYCLWAADYMMGNGGDLANMVDMYPRLLSDGQTFAAKLGLPASAELFGLSQLDFEREYYERLEAVCDEIRKAEPS